MQSEPQEIRPALSAGEWARGRFYRDDYYIDFNYTNGFEIALRGTGPNFFVGGADAMYALAAEILFDHPQGFRLRDVEHLRRAADVVDANPPGVRSHLARELRSIADRLAALMPAENHAEQLSALLERPLQPPEKE